MCILREALGQVRHETVAPAIEDPWVGHFGPEVDHNAGGGLAVYRCCLRCRGMAMLGSLSAHARWCDRDLAAAELHAEAV